MKAQSVFAKMVLLPCSKVYGAVTYMRNKFFDWKLLKETEFEVPVISVGNLAVGGTGKTPHVEYLIGAFRKSCKVAMLSRGYRRKTKGFIIAGRTSTPSDIGDEAYQVYHKFNGEVIVAVCEDRVLGINELRRLDPAINLIILDDAFQHRYVKPAVSVLITEYANPIYTDKMLPYGRLREPSRGVNRADIVIVSKCPATLKPFDYSTVAYEYNLFPSQFLFFSRYAYRKLQPVFPDVATAVPYIDWLNEGDSILVVAGIGNPKPFVRHVKSFPPKVKVDVFPDHHAYSRKDFDHILSRFRTLKGQQRLIVTTEKDAVRMASNPYFPFELRQHTFFLPIEVEFDPFGNGPDIVEAIRKLIRERSIASAE
ncbi:MAG: tetraacyldisaccharide 4'-kinase [Muribaculaceae bacterium]|nr:tetraacyldisaccharide 4'-kinase [Muribaculaceae bacterium]MDE6135172.1 tetraacyldisaccharide 4'-kinase [Muribaculaceae bacterium]